jgi:hypothetical protein
MVTKIPTAPIGLERGTNLRVLDPAIDGAFVEALRSSPCKIMLALPDGGHQEVMLRCGDINFGIAGTRCYMNLEATAPELRALLKPVELPAGTIDRVNAYVSPACCGTPLHFDIRTVWIVQLFGTKIWEVAASAVVENPSRNCVAPPNASWIDYDGRSLRTPTEFSVAVLQPGDWLQVRKGVWHRTFTTHGSVSATLAASEQT